MTPIEKHFAPFRSNTMAMKFDLQTPYGNKKMIYADWIASGRLYKPIEEQIATVFGAFVGNTHTETSERVP